MAKNEKMTPGLKAKIDELKTENRQAEAEEAANIGVGVGELKYEDAAKIMKGLEGGNEISGVSIKELDEFNKYVDDALQAIQNEDRGGMSQAGANKATKDLEDWKKRIQKTKTAIINKDAWTEQKAS